MLYPLVALLLIANVINIGADIGAIAASVELLLGIPSLALVAPIGIAIALLEVVAPYASLARYLKLLTLVVFAYIAGAFFADPEWAPAVRATLTPRADLDAEGIGALVAILGTTISPYLFFWQTSEEVEEEEEKGIQATKAGAGQIASLLRAANFDVATGMLMAHLGFYFVVLTAAAALHASGQTDVSTAAEAAEALPC
ncbi:MAG: divalent metal cation transporter [Dehalococcoidia bacterium]|nr:divalent metal cation transporter [Dehalococcoidia bacterium]